MDLASKTISFRLLVGRPSIRIMNEEIIKPPENKTHAINSIRNLGKDAVVSKEEIQMKIEETNLINSNEKKQLEDLL